MPRRPSYARAKKTFEDGSVLYAWRDAPGGREQTAKGPGGKANLLAYQAHVLDCWERNVAPSPPADVLEEDPIKAKQKARRSIPTVAEWVGTAQAPGEFFRHTSRRQSAGQVAKYFYLTASPAVSEVIGDKRLDHVTPDLAEQVLDRILACPRCIERGLNYRQARADESVPECPLHRPESMLRRTTVMKARTSLGALFNSAQRAGYEVRNPFTFRTIGHWVEPLTNDDCRTALTIPQFHKLLEAHDDDLKVIPALSVYGMLRLSEMWGLRRGIFPVPPVNPDDDPSTISFRLEGVWVDSEKRFRPWGKNERSTGSTIAIPSTGVKILNARLRRNLQPNGECPACAAGKELWRGPVHQNPHEECGWANDAPIVPLELCRPIRYSRTVARQAQEAAGLSGLPFTITHRSFRSTGATMHLRAGTHLHEVVQMGRWENATLLLETYFRLYGEAYGEAVARLDRNEAAELGLDESEDAPVDARLRFLQRKVESLQGDLLELRAENDDLRGQLGLEARPEKPAIVPVSVERRIAKWAETSDDDLRAAVDGARNQLEILQRLGLAPAAKNYRMLRRRAGAIDLALPDLWANPAASQ